ncbi:hypothetical protein D3C87_1342540 [compost metagenome]
MGIIQEQMVRWNTKTKSDNMRAEVVVTPFAFMWVRLFNIQSNKDFKASGIEFLNRAEFMLYGVQNV